jgi:hypothetical protein
MAWLRIYFNLGDKKAVRWLNLSRVTDVYIDMDDDNPRASFYSGSDLMLSFVVDGGDVQVQWYDDRDASVVMKWDLDELYEGKMKEVVMRRLTE